MHFMEENYWPHNTALFTSDFKGNIPKYVFYLLQCIGRIKTSDKSAVPGVNRNELHEMRVPVETDKKQQLQIANFLSLLDEKIELNNRINAELEGLAKLLYDYWFVQFDFPMTAEQAAAHGDPTLTGKPYKSSGGKMTHNKTLNRKIPEGWKASTLGDICENIRETVDPTKISEGCPYVGLEHIPKKQFFLHSWGRSADVKSQKASFGARDFLFGKLRPYFHKVVRPGFAGICSTDILVLRAKKAVYEGFVGSLIYSSHFVESISKQWGGAQMPRANWKSMAQFAFPLPPKNDGIIEDYNSAIQPLWASGANNQKQNQELAALRDWLLPMLMNGQVTVS
jgi:type I restriction enzyme S subunit